MRQGECCGGNLTGNDHCHSSQLLTNYVFILDFVVVFVENHPPWFTSNLCVFDLYIHLNNISFFEFQADFHRFTVSRELIKITRNSRSFNSCCHTFNIESIHFFFVLFGVFHVIIIQYHFRVSAYQQL